MRELLIIGLAVLGGALITGVKLPRWNIRKYARQALGYAASLSENRPQNAREYVDRINGSSRENFVRRTMRESRQIYDQIGQSDRYRKVIAASILCSALGIGIGAFMNNWMLSVVLAAGLYFVSRRACR